MNRDELWQQVHAARDEFYGGDPLYHADTPQPTPACPRCDDHGEITRPTTRDEFGNWDTETVVCSCPAGDVVAANIAAARVWNDARRNPAHEEPR